MCMCTYTHLHTSIISYMDLRPRSPIFSAHVQNPHCTHIFTQNWICIVHMCIYSLWTCTHKHTQTDSTIVTHYLWQHHVCDFLLQWRWLWICQHRESAVPLMAADLDLCNTIHCLAFSLLLICGVSKHQNAFHASTVPSSVCIISSLFSSILISLSLFSCGPKILPLISLFIPPSFFQFPVISV